MTEPTNSDLFVLIENQTDAFKLHAADDHEIARKQGLVNSQQQETNLQIQEALRRIEDKIDPIVELWDSSIVVKKALAGLGGAILGLIALGGGIFWIFNHLKP